MATDFEAGVEELLNRPDRGSKRAKTTIEPKSVAEVSPSDGSLVNDPFAAGVEELLNRPDRRSKEDKGPKDAEPAGMFSKRSLSPTLHAIAPTVVRTLAGAAMGIEGGPPGMLAGAGLANIAGPIGDAGVSAINIIFGTKFGTTKEATSHVLTHFGFPAPETYSERMVEAATQAGVETLTGARLGEAASSLVSSPVVKAIAKAFSEAPGKQTAASVFGALTGETARTAAKEIGAPEWVQGAANIGGQLAGTVGPIMWADASKPLKAMGAVADNAGRPIPATPPSAIANFWETVKGPFSKEAVETRGRVQSDKMIQDVLGRHVPEAQRENVIGQLKTAAEMEGAPGAQLMSGDVTSEPGMLALQQSLRPKSLKMQQRDIENTTAIASGVTEGLAPEGAKAAAAQGYFKSKLDELQAAAEAAKKEQSLNVDKAPSERLAKAQESLGQLKSDAESGKLSHETAHESAVEEFNRALDDIRKYRESTIIENASESARSSLESLEDLEKKHIVDPLYEQLRAVKGTVTFDKTAEAIDSVKKKAGIAGVEDLNRALSAVEKAVFEDVTTESGDITRKAAARPEFEAQAVDTKLSELIRDANQNGRANEARQLNEIRQSLFEDIGTSIPEASEAAKRAKAGMADYATRYIHGNAEKIFRMKGNVAPSKTLDLLLKGKENREQLREMIRGIPIESLTPEVSAARTANQVSSVNAIGDYLVTDLATKLGNSPTPEALRTWRQTKGNAILETFPTLKGRIDDIEESLNAAYLKRDQSKELLAAVKANMSGSPEEIALNAKIKEANAEVKAAEKSATLDAQAIFDSATKKIKEHPAQKFIGGTPSEVVGEILASGASRKANLEKLVEMAKTDPSGATLEGVKNAVREYLDWEIRETAGPTLSGTKDKGPVGVESFPVRLSKINALIAKKDVRESLETVFGKGSRELNALDVGRAEIDAMNQRSKVSSKAAGGVEEAMAAAPDTESKTLLSILSDVAFFGGKHTLIKGAAKSLKRAWSGKASERAFQELEDAQLNPKKMIELLTPIEQLSESQFNRYMGPLAQSPATGESMINRGIEAAKSGRREDFQAGPESEKAGSDAFMGQGGLSTPPARSRQTPFLDVPKPTKVRE